jgi:hypothetical protein
MKALDKQAWTAAYNSEFVGFQQNYIQLEMLLEHMRISLKL